MVTDIARSGNYNRYQFVEVYGMNRFLAIHITCHHDVRIVWVYCFYIEALQLIAITLFGTMGFNNFPLVC